MRNAGAFITVVRNGYFCPWGMSTTGTVLTVRLVFILSFTSREVWQSCCDGGRHLGLSGPGLCQRRRQHREGSVGDGGGVLHRAEGEGAGEDGAGTHKRRHGRPNREPGLIV